MPQAPTGTVTFLFSDIESSTRLWEDAADTMRECLSVHDQLIRDAVDRNGGLVFATGGDGFAVAFGRAGDALMAAAESQRALQARAWPASVALHVRMGIHTGEAIESGGDYFGPTVNRAARLMSTGHGDQVLVSATTAQLAVDTELRDLGEHRLRDLSRSEHVFQLVGAGLREEFPPLRSLDATATNLPAQLTSLVGREKDVAAVVNLVDQHRLVTITGVGGVGKTRLALQVAADMLPRFSDGAWLCELASAQDDFALVQVIATAVGVIPRTGMTLDASIVEYLRSRELLLVLDNCEHLIEQVARLAADIVRSCPRVRVLATSREGLSIDGEHVRPVRALAVPATGDADADADTASVRLFGERAHAVRNDFVVGGSNLDAVVEICRRLDGLPLAIELAAARTEAMSPSEIATRLDERFRLLTGGRRTAVERHQTLRATVEWSYALLSTVERAVFERLGVFAGSFDGAAVRAVVTDDDLADWEAFDALSSLVGKSLVVAEQRPVGTTRYEMLETLRQYAREKLAENDDADVWRRRHAQHYCALVDEIGALLIGVHEMEERARLAFELDNVRAAYAWALDAADVADVELAVGLVVVLCDEGTFNRTLGIGAWAQRALDRLDGTSEPRRKAVLAAAAYEAFHLGDYDSAEQLSLRAIEGGAAEGCPRPCVGYYVLGMQRMITGRSADAIALVPEMQREHERIGAADYDVGRMHSHSSQWYTQAGRTDEALAHAELAVKYGRRTGCQSLIANALYSYGASLAPVDASAALAAYDESIAAGPLDSSAHWVASLYQSALLLCREGRHAEALRRLRQSLGSCLDRGELPQLDGGIAYSLEILAELGRAEDVLVLVGALRDGALGRLRTMTVPAERKPREMIARAREALDLEVRAAAMARGASATYTELVDWLLHTLDELIASAA